MEEKYVKLTDQLSSVTERLDHAEHDLDLERISREDIIRAEIERRMAEERKKLEEEYAEKVRLVEQEKKEHEEMLQRKMEKHEADLKTTYANMTQKVIADACRQVEEARQKAESNGMAKMEQLKRDITYIIGNERAEGNLEPLTVEYISRLLKVPVEEVEECMKEMGM